mmetsp:Transcript_40560/g.129319  ORF Transcript_40560/g.129319 Transcript_40560/m.129319 type:complete len:1181 (+) Transcript_40560:325-3867(+)
MYSNSDAMSDASSVTSDGASDAASEDHDEEFGDALTERAGIEEIVFGGLSLIQDYRWTSFKYAFCKGLLDWTQLICLAASHIHYWDIDRDNWFWKWFFRLQLSNVAIEQGYDGFLTIFYLLTIVNTTNWLLLGYACYCFKVNKIRMTWPLKWLANSMCCFHSVLYVSGILVLIASFDTFSNNSKLKVLEEFPEEKFGGMPNMIHSSWGVINAVLFIVMQFWWSVSSATLDPTTRYFFGASQPMTETRDFIVKTVLILVHTLVTPWEIPRTVVELLLAWALYWQVMRWAPYYNERANQLKAASYFSVFIAYCANTARAFTTEAGDDTGSLTLAMIGAAAVAFPLGWLLMGARLRFGRHQFVRLEDYTTLSHKRWIDEWEVEIFSRLLRQTDQGGDPIPENIQEVEELLKAATHHFPQSAFVHMVYSGFITHVAHAKTQLAQTHNDRARKLSPNVALRFMIFARAQKLKDEEANNANNESAMDLVSYVEFQKNHRLLVRVHREALSAVRAFWRLLMRKDVTFPRMSAALKRMDDAEQRGISTYAIVMERYPKSVKLMRSYGRFLEEVKNDPWTGGKYLAEADRVEEAQAEAQRDAMFSKSTAADADPAAVETTQVDDQTDAVCVINSTGIIQFTNKLLNKMFGYRKEELAGKNVSCLMPSPFSQNHNTYLRAYATTGKAKILDRIQYSLVALHKNRYVFPIDLVVTKVEHGGKDAYMGVIKKLEEDTTMALIYVTWGGTIMCGNNVFTDMLGYAPMELVGKPVSVLAKEEDVHRMMEFATDEAHAEELAEHEFTLDVVHKYGMRFDVKIHMMMGGTKDQRIIVWKVRPVDVSTAYCVVDKTGRFHFYNRVFAEMLGYRAGRLDESATLSQVLPETHVAFHSKWLSSDDGSPSGSGAGCLSGINVTLLSRGGDLVPATLTVSSSQDPITYLQLYCACIKRIKPRDLLSGSSVELALAPNGVIESVEGSAWSVFGYNGGDLQAAPVSTLADVVDSRINLIMQSRDASAGPADPEQRLQRVLHGMLEQTRKGVVPFWRATVRPNTGSPPVAARLELLPDPAAEGGLVARVIRVDKLDGYLEVDARMKVLAVHGHLDVILGYPRRVIEQTTVVQLLPGVCDSGSILELMGSSAQGGGGGVKKATVGSKRQVTARHADGTHLQVTVETARISKEADSNYVVRCLDKF